MGRRVRAARHIVQNARGLVGAVARQESDVFLNGKLAVDLVRQPLLQIDRDVVEGGLGDGRVGIEFAGIEGQRG